MSHAKNSHGFTLIELMLAMGFVSVLLIAIAMTVIQIANIYNRGITLKDVNQAGRSIVTDLQKSIYNSSRFDLDSDHYVVQPWGGRLCLGQYSYIWNNGVDIAAPANPSRNTYNTSTQEIRFVKVLDPMSTFCKIPTTKPNFSSAIELLSVSEHNLAIHNFSISTTASATDRVTRQQLYSVSFLIGTNDQNALKNNPKVCKSPGEPGSDLAYCSVNRFNIVVRAGNPAE